MRADPAPPLASVSRLGRHTILGVAALGYGGTLQSDLPEPDIAPDFTDIRPSTLLGEAPVKLGVEGTFVQAGDSAAEILPETLTPAHKDLVDKGELKLSGGYFAFPEAKRRRAEAPPRRVVSKAQPARVASVDGAVVAQNSYPAVQFGLVATPVESVPAALPFEVQATPVVELSGSAGIDTLLPIAVTPARVVKDTPPLAQSSTADAVSPLQQKMLDSGEMKVAGGYYVFEEGSNAVQTRPSNANIEAKPFADLANATPGSNVAQDAPAVQEASQYAPPQPIKAGAEGSSSLSGQTGIDDISSPPPKAPGPDIVFDEEGNLQMDPMQPELLTQGGLTLSGGYSSVEGPNFEVKLARSNIGGLGREFTASARYSKLQMLAEIGYADSNFMGSGTQFAPSLFANRLSAIGFGSGDTSTPFRQSARGINLYFNKVLDDGISATANYRLSDDAFTLRGKNALCNASLFSSPICDAVGDDTTSMISFAFTLDRRDDARNPTSGFRLRLSQDLAGLGGSTRFSRTRLSGSAYIEISEGWNLSLGAEGGYLAPFGDRPTPLFDRFYIGGTSLRGFDLRGIGPKIRPSAASLDQSVAIGGRIFYTARAELAVPVGGIFGKYGIEPSIFVDAGSVFGAKPSTLLSGEILLGNSAQPRVAVGAGLGINTPLGKLRIDFAEPVVKQPGDRAKTFSISFGGAM